MRDETWEMDGGETEGVGYSNTPVAELEISINNRKSLARVAKHGRPAIEAAQPEVRKWGVGEAGGWREDWGITAEGWRNAAIGGRSAGFGLSLSASLNSPQSDGHFEVPQSCLNPA